VVHLVIMGCASCPHGVSGVSAPCQTLDQHGRQQHACARILACVPHACLRAGVLACRCACVACVGMGVRMRFVRANVCMLLVAYVLACLLDCFASSLAGFFIMCLCLFACVWMCMRACMRACGCVGASGCACACRYESACRYEGTFKLTCIWARMSIMRCTCDHAQVVAAQGRSTRAQHNGQGCARPSQSLDQPRRVSANALLDRVTAC
jgi:hypothetical protein